MSEKVQKRNRAIAVAVIAALGAWLTPLTIFIEPVKQVIEAFDTDDTTSEEVTVSK